MDDKTKKLLDTSEKVLTLIKDFHSKSDMLGWTKPTADQISLLIEFENSINNLKK